MSTRMRIFLFVTCSLTAGCSINPLVHKAADANDRAVSMAEFTICHGASVGSIRRAYAHRQDVWTLLCASGETFDPHIGD